MNRMWKSSLWMLLPLAVSSRQAQLLFPSFQVLRTSQVGPVSHSPARLPSGLSAWRVIGTMCDLLPLPPPIPSFPPLFIHLCSFFQFFHIYILNICLPFPQLCLHNPYLHPHSSPTTPRTYKNCSGSNQTTAQHREGEVNQ